MKNFKKFFYPNRLANQNITARANLVWVIDITELELKGVEKPPLFVFLCLDIHTNFIVTWFASFETISPPSIVRVLKKALPERFPLPPETLLILHSDRGDQFTSRCYHNFVSSYQDYLQPSMSRPKIPTDNAVAERFMRTFKTHRIQERTLAEALEEEFSKNPNFRSYRAWVQRYVTSLNQKPNRKTKKQTPLEKDAQVNTAAMLMQEPLYGKGFSSYLGDDFRIAEIEKYRQENAQLIDWLSEMDSHSAEVVAETPFDPQGFQQMNQRMEAIGTLMRHNPALTRAYVKEAVQPLYGLLDEMNQKMDQLLVKSNPIASQQKQKQKRRDGFSQKLFPIFLEKAGCSVRSRRKDLKKAQLRLCYTLMYHLGIRLHEIRHVTLADFQTALVSSRFPFKNKKTQRSYCYVLSTGAIEDLENLTEELEIVFEKYQYRYLFGKTKLIHQKALIRLVNTDLASICQRAHLPENITSHSFRIHVTTSLLEVTTAENVAEIMGHRDIRTSMQYRKYCLSKAQIQQFLQQISDST